MPRSTCTVMVSCWRFFGLDLHPAYACILLFSLTSSAVPCPRQRPECLSLLFLFLGFHVERPFFVSETDRQSRTFFFKKRKSIISF